MPSGEQSLIRILRQPPALAVDDSVSRALDLLRYSGWDLLPVTERDGRLAGVITLDSLRPLLGMGAAEAALVSPVSTWSRQTDSIGRASMSVDEIRRLLSESGESAIVIVDDSGRFLGTVSLADLLLPLPINPRPSPIGGMATPWGVYLTNGSIQAGVSNRALVGGGLVMGLMFLLANFAVGSMTWMAERFAGWPLYSLWQAPEPKAMTIHNVGWLLLKALVLPVFLLLLRVIPLSRYHAAEHQTVHAMERGEALRPEIVARMPRVHPRCGTNILAAGLIFALISQLFAVVLPNWLGDSDAAILGAITALFTFRSFGAFLQQYFTTAQASEKHILSGIRAGQDLEAKFLAAPPGRPAIWRRIWCMGLLQILTGVLVITGAPWVLDVAGRLFR